MKFNFAFLNTIRGKIGFIAAAGMIISVTVISTTSIVTLRNMEINSAIQNAKSISLDLKNEIKTNIDVGLDATINIANALQINNILADSIKLSRTQVLGILKNELNNNPDFLGTYTLWEPNKFDGKDQEYISAEGHDGTGRFIPYWYRCNNVLALTPIENYDNDEKTTGTYYNVSKTTKKEAVIDPYFYKACDQQTFMMSCIAPVVNGNDFVGLVGVDFEIKWLQNLLLTHASDLYGGEGRATILSANGTVAATTLDTSKIGKPVGELFTNNKSYLNATSASIHEFKDGTLYIYSPITFGKTDNIWIICITIPEDVVTAHAVSLMWRFIVMSVVFVIGFSVLIIYFINRFVSPINLITQNAQKLATGSIEETKIKVDTLEIQELNLNFSKLSKSQRQITEVCKSISEGDFSKYAEVRSDEDVLSLSVNKMIDNLKLAAEADAKRNWTANGLAKFAELLRSNEDTHQMYNNVLSELIKYINANQGCLFIKIDEESEVIRLKLESCYAYNRKKFINKIILAGEGLAGQAYLEAQTIFLKKVPEDYIRIGSGLGDALPRCVLVVPIKFNDQIEGILELASFNVYQPHEIAFVEKIAETIASVVSSIKINERTKNLLAETTQQTEEMRSQEEEMRQNMEELLATQEEVARKEREYLTTIETLKIQLAQLSNN